jgi:ADP-ribose pyrophosphatase YjhB (NUDIX family)
MRFCSECGQRVLLQRLERDQRERHVCSGCGKVHYTNPQVIVGCFVHWQDRVVFCRRAEEPEAGAWMIPSGFLEHGETLQAGAAREAYEECGVRVDPARLELYAIWSMPSLGQVGISFRVEHVDAPLLKAGAECLDVALLSEAEVPFDRLAWGAAAANPMRLFFAQLRARRFGIHLRELSVDGISDSALRAYPLERTTDD